MEGLDRVVVGLTQEFESVLHSMLDKPHSSTVHIRHDSRALDLNKLRCVVEMNSNKARDSPEEEGELKKDSLFNSCLVFANCF